MRAYPAYQTFFFPLFIPPVYVLCKTALSLSIIIFSLTILQIFASWLMIKSEKSHDEYIKELENQSSANENISTENLEINNSQV